MPPDPQAPCPVGQIDARSPGLRRVALRAAAAVVLVTMAGGCGSRRPEMAQVVGTVSLDGEPLAHGTLTFEAPGLRPATARIVDGRIVDATTYRPGDGVPLGTHAIAVFAREATPMETAPAPGTARFTMEGIAGRSLVPRRYNAPATSGLSATIAAGTNSLSLALTRQPPRHE